MKHSVTNTPLRLLIIALFVVAFSVSTAFAQDANQDTDKVNQAKESFNGAIEAVKNGDTTTAISMYKGAIQLDESMADAYLNLGSIYFAQDKFKEAETTFKKYTELKADDPIGFSNLAKVYMVQKKNTQAKTAYESALAADPNYSEAHKELGKIFYNMKDYDASISSLQKYTTAVTDDYYAFYLLGAALEKKKQTNDAVAAYKNALKAKPDHFESLRNLGKIYAKKENYTLAIDYYKQAMKVKPKDYKTAYNLAIAVQSKDPEDYDTIIAQWDKFVKLARKIPKAKKYMANAENLLKQLREAKAVADEG